MQPQAYSATTTPDPQLIKPSKAWYWASGAFGLLAVVLGAIAIANIVSLFANVERFTSPQVLTVTTDREVTRGVFTQTNSVNTDIRVVRLDGGSANARVAPDNDDWVFEFSNETWIRVAQVTFPDAGTYEVSASPAGAEFALVPELEPFFVRVGAWFAAAAGALGISLILLIVTLVRRRKAKRSLESQMPLPPPPPPPPGQGATHPTTAGGWEQPPAFPEPPQPRPETQTQPEAQPQPEPEPVAPPKADQGPPPKSSTFDPFAPPPAPPRPESPPSEPTNPISNPPEDRGPISRG